MKVDEKRMKKDLEDSNIVPKFAPVFSPKQHFYPSWIILQPEQGRIIVTWVPKSRNRYQLFSKEDLDVLKSLI